MPILFCNVGWMERYQGLRAGDQISGGGAYVKKEGRGHEVCNFSPDNDTLYGYVQAPGAQINLERLGANSGDDSITGVTVVWTATRPGGHTVIVGWYKDATVFRDYQKFKKVPRAQSQNGIDGYRITAPVAGATLVLPIDARVVKIPRQVKGEWGKAMFGMRTALKLRHSSKGCTNISKAVNLHARIAQSTVGHKIKKGKRE